MEKLLYVRVPSCTLEKRFFSLTDWEIEMQERWLRQVRRIRGSREWVAESPQRWEVKLSSRPHRQWDNAVARTALTAQYLILLSCSPALYFPCRERWGLDEQASSATVLLMSAFYYRPAWLYFFFQVFWDVIDIQHCVSSKCGMWGVDTHITKWLPLSH